MIGTSDCRWRGMRCVTVSLIAHDQLYKSWTKTHVIQFRLQHGSNVCEMLCFLYTHTTIIASRNFKMCLKNYLFFTYQVYYSIPITSLKAMSKSGSASSISSIGALSSTFLMRLRNSSTSSFIVDCTISLLWLCELDTSVCVWKAYLWQAASAAFCTICLIVSACLIVGCICLIGSFVLDLNLRRL